MKTRQKSRDASGILLVCLMWMLSLSSSLHAQTWNINGNVTDEQGEPIIGANVVIQGTGTGTITDVEGNFKLASVTKGAVMEISFIGYISKTLQVKDASSLKIVLKEDNQALDEVVVVGYGVQRKSDLTGSVASVNSDVLESRPQANLIQSLQGAVPGLNISVTGSNAEGSSTTTRIRGNNSITADNKPLVILDGIPFKYQICATGVANSICPIRSRRTADLVTSTPHRSHTTPLYLIFLYFPQLHSQSLDGPKILSQNRPSFSGF